MGEVVPLKIPTDEPLVWQCDCGSFAFWLYSDGTGMCVKCETEIDGMDGYWRVPTRCSDEP